MLSQKLPFALTIPDRQTNSKKDELPSPNSLSPTNTRRRKGKHSFPQKTNEQLIQQSHQQLLRFVDRLDEQVQKVVGKYQAEFLSAYRNHVKKVKDEIEQIKKRSINNANSQIAYQQKIDALEKQIIVFRQGSLKISQKIIKKDQEIEALKIRVKEVEGENQYLQKTLLNLTKRNKQLSASVEKEKIYIANMNQNLINTRTKQCKSAQQSPNNKSVLFYKQVLMNETEQRGNTADPFSKAHSFNLRHPLRTNFPPTSINKQERSTPIFDRSSNNKVNNKQEVTTTDKQKMSANDYRKRLKLRSRGQIIKTSSELQRLKSKQFAQKNDNEKYFIRCVEQVKKQLMRRHAGSNLNYFKENGPISLLEFKKLDFFVLMELLFKNEDILTRLYQFIFKSNS